MQFLQKSASYVHLSLKWDYLPSMKWKGPQADFLRITQWTSNQPITCNPNSNSDEERRFMYKINQGHLFIFCIYFVWRVGPPSPVRIMTQVPWFMYQNQLGPSGGIYYPNFVPCFVVLYLNTKKFHNIKKILYLNYPLLIEHTERVIIPGWS